VTLLLDEFGAVIKMAAQREIAILQRGRSHGGQVIMITQSVADVEALAGQKGLLASLTDNFAGVVAHRQTSPEWRDWLAKLMGTRALWHPQAKRVGTVKRKPAAAALGESASSESLLTHSGRSVPGRL
jgi:hypothetical protein